MLRKGSLSGIASEFGDAELLKLALQDYVLARRRERASRSDFLSGWLAAMRRLKWENCDPELLSEDLTQVA